MERPPGRDEPLRQVRKNNYLEGNHIAKLIKPGEAFPHREVRLIDAEGEQVGIVSYADARKRAVDAKLDLVLVADKSAPPVCRIMDFGKLIFEQKKNLKAQKKNNVTQKVKEIQFHINIDKHDYETKLNRGIDFLEKGYKLKVALSFRGREMQHQDLGFGLIAKITEDLAEFGSTDEVPKLNGRTIIIHFNPVKQQKGKTKPKAQDNPDEEDDTVEVEIVESTTEE